MRCRKWFIAVMLASAAALFAPAAPAGDENLDPQTEQQLRALNNLVDELKETAPDYAHTQRAGRGERLNQAFVALTGQAVNPLFGVTVLGMYNYFRADEAVRDRLPLYDRPVVWVPLICIILLMLFNATICEAMPFLKVPLNALGDIVNKAGAVVVLPLVVKMFADTVAAPAGEALRQTAMTAFPTAQAAEGVILSTAYHSAGWALGAVVGTIVYLAVWMAFNVVDVLIVICPFPGVDALLKSFRLSVLAVLAGSQQISPVLSIVIAAAVVLLSFLLAGWSFRLSAFGFVYSTDIILFRKRKPSDGPVLAFASIRMNEEKKLPMRTFGHLERRGERDLVFSYRPWLILGRREIPLGDGHDFSCGLGLINPFLVRDLDPDRPWLRFPPRYRDAEEDLARAFSLRRVVACGLSGSLRSWLVSQFSHKHPCADAA